MYGRRVYYRIQNGETISYFDLVRRYYRDYNSNLLDENDLISIAKHLDDGDNFEILVNQNDFIIHTPAIYQDDGSVWYKVFIEGLFENDEMHVEEVKYFYKCILDEEDEAETEFIL